MLRHLRTEVRLPLNPSEYGRPHRVVLANPVARPPRDRLLDTVDRRLSRPLVRRPQVRPRDLLRLGIFIT